MSLKTKTFTTVYKLLTVITIFATISVADVTISKVDVLTGNVYLLDGTFDIDGDRQLEYLALLKPTAQQAPQALIYFEYTPGLPVAITWRYDLAAGLEANLVDARVTNVDGNDKREIVLLLHHQSLPENATPDWLYLFDWDDQAANFSTIPTFKWNYRGHGISYLRPTSLAVADLDGDNNDELVVSTGSPDRMVVVANWRRNSFRLLEEIRPDRNSTGQWPFSAAIADLNGDIRPDILTVGHGPRPEITAHLKGRRGYHAVPVKPFAGSKILPKAIATGDIEGDGQEELIVAHSDGSLSRVGMVGPDLAVEQLDTRITDLVDIISVKQGANAADIRVFLKQNGSALYNDGQLQTLVGQQHLGQVLTNMSDSLLAAVTLIATPAQSERSAAISYIINTSAGAYLVHADIGTPIAVRDIVDVSTPGAAMPLPVTPTPVIPTTPGTVAIEETATEVYMPDQQMAPDPRALPATRSPDYLLYVGDEFTRNVLGDRADDFANFRFLRKPSGMVFNLQRQGLVWQPTSEHYGAWNVELVTTFQTGVSYEDMVSDSIQEFKVIPETVDVRDQLLIYVNDKPRIIGQPENMSIVAGDLFAYRMRVNDKNSDAKLDYRLESGPVGMELDQAGIVTWRTNESHHDDYQVVISVSDGFDKDLQTFTINVNAKITITSTTPNLAHLGELYSYPLSIFQPGSPKSYVFTLLDAPDGMAVDAKGVINWTPQLSQIDTQYFQIRISDGKSEDVQSNWIYVNAQPEIIDQPPVATVIANGDTLKLNFAGQDANALHDLEWSVTSGPVTMTIDSSGQLLWSTTLQDLDAARYVVQLSDGIDESVFRGVVFVNSPLSIISTPNDSASIGESYRYQVKIRDNNRSSLLKFRRPTIVSDILESKAYIIQVEDDKIRRELGRYLSQFREQKNIYINKPHRPESGQVTEAARIDLKQAVKHIFIDDGNLVLVITSPARAMVELQDVLWEFFQGGRGIMPQYTSNIIPFFHYSLHEFPDGMTISEEGLITWAAAPEQAGAHQVRFTVSDGYTRDEQAFSVYANYPPAIVSSPDTMATVEARYAYQLRVDDKNDDKQLSYRLIKAPEGMMVAANGLITWLPSVEQLNWQEFEVEVSDGHSVDRQAATLFVNISPRIISQPKPVALNSYEYSYRLVAEDLNRDAMLYSAVKLPRYSEFDARTGLFRWRPRDLQKGPNDIIFEVTDSHGGTTVHEFQVHVFDDPSRRQILFTGWPLLMAFAGVIFVLGITLGG
ncbi:FG-GAP repeat domain-containing protein [Candidatus Neomarinimicrobiota bacterium]